METLRRRGALNLFNRSLLRSRGTSERLLSARKREFLDCKLAAPVRFFRGFEARFRVHLLRHACSFLVVSFVVFNVLRFSLNRFFTLIAFDKKENAVPMQMARDFLAG